MDIFQVRSVSQLTLKSFRLWLRTSLEIPTSNRSCKLFTSYSFNWYKCEEVWYSHVSCLDDALLHISLTSAPLTASSSTIPVPTPPVSPSPLPSSPSSPSLALASTTLRPGALSLAIAGTLESLGPTALLAGPNTDVFLSQAQTLSAGLAPLILSRLGGQTGASSGAAVATGRVSGASSTAFVGVARRGDCVTGWRRWAAGLVVGLGVCC